MSRERQQKQSGEMRNKILAIARRIVAEEGPDALSIRRITGEMDYSAGIVYHYFKNKDEILHSLLLEGYGRILASIRMPPGDLPPGQALHAAIAGYIAGVLEWPGEYRAVMFSSKPAILAVTSVLGEDVREKRAAIDWLAATLESGVEQGAFAPCDPVETAQALWCAMFGMATRLIIEGVEEGRRQKLVQRVTDLLLKGVAQ